ncbi:hypothetical protein LIA77_10704 [Sarocladium implicatum]|nr:hypothetical protein LIA77_10704 [Sarocladium implicatum]
MKHHKRDTRNNPGRQSRCSVSVTRHQIHKVLKQSHPPKRTILIGSTTHKNKALMALTGHLSHTHLSEK